MLIQIDGSHHRWLGDDHPQFDLHLAVDDATGRVLAANFRPDEDACGYFELIGELIRENGTPLALYSDRHSVFVPALRSHQPKLAEGATQFARATSELGIRQVFAGSAQTKGRVKRACGTFQDRLVTELRLAGGKNDRRRQLPAYPVPGTLQPPVRGGPRATADRLPPAGSRDRSGPGALL